MEPARQIEQPALLNSILPLELSRIGFDAEGETLLDDVNLNFSDGESSIVLGPNGAGKTLLLRICHGLLLPSRGTVRWQSESIAQTPTAQAMVFQQPVVLRRNVRQNIEYAIKVCGVESSLQQRRLASALEVTVSLAMTSTCARLPSPRDTSSMQKISFLTIRSSQDGSKAWCLLTGPRSHVPACTR